MAVRDNRARREYLANHLAQLFSKQNPILFVECANVSSFQMAQIRRSLRGVGTLCIAKKTLMKAVLRNDPQLAEENANLLPQLEQNIGLVFCEGEPGDLKRIIEMNKVPAPARQGSIAPDDVWLQAGATGMDPAKTGLFQAMSIPTKIVKGQVEILNDIHIVKLGEKVSASAASLLQKLGYKPFFYGLKVVKLFQNDSLIDSALLNLQNEDFLQNLKTMATNLKAISLAAHYPTRITIPNILVNAYRRLIALAVPTTYHPPEVEAMLNAASTAVSAAPVSAAVPAAGAAAAAESEESDGDLGLDLFG